jgi:hypothetical protein
LVSSELAKVLASLGYNEMASAPIDAMASSQEVPSVATVVKGSRTRGGDVAVIVDGERWLWPWPWWWR